MNTILYSLSYVGQTFDKYRFDRQQKWLNYYIPLLPKLNCNKIIMTDNHSDLDTLKKLDVVIFDENKNLLFEGNNKKVEIYRFNKYQDKLKGDFKNPFMNCPYWWRGLFWITNLTQQYQKIIYFDSDFFILSPRIIEYINHLKEGWNTFWCSKHRFPEATAQIICNDKYNRFNMWTTIGQENLCKTIGELILPFSNICKDFHGDRWFEYDGTLTQQFYWDYIAQCNISTIPLFNPELTTSSSKKQNWII